MFDAALTVQYKEKYHGAGAARRRILVQQEPQRGALPAHTVYFCLACCTEELKGCLLIPMQRWDVSAVQWEVYYFYFFIIHKSSPLKK
jgi:hypothetical protein